jgi:hypothetical protein
VGPVRQPPEFVGWWELIFYIRGGQSQDIEGAIEHIHSDGRFEAYRNGALIAAGRHLDFQTDPPGFTNVQEDPHVLGVRGRELVIYRLAGEMLEVCKAPESDGRPERFGSPAGTSIVHATIRRMTETDSRIPIGSG